MFTDFLTNLKIFKTRNHLHQKCNIFFVYCLTKTLYTFSRETLDVVKQSAALCLLRLFRTDPSIIPGGEWTSRIVHLLNDQHMGVVTAASSLIDALVKKNPDEYKGCVSLAVSRLSRIVTSSYTDFQVHLHNKC